MQEVRPLFHAFILLALFWPATTLSQQGFRIDLPKEEEYKDRLLRSEKTKDGKLKYPSKLVQNTVTHYNFTFNAAKKLNEVLQKAKNAHRDDYSNLLSFYNFSLGTTRKDSIDLDSVIQKASSGIALHDLRNDWNDNLYLLWGMAYYLQEKFDSAYLVFQFINYYYAPREKDGYFKVIGSGRDGNQANSIASEEKTGLLNKLGTAPPKRNEALLWIIRTQLAQEQYAEAAGLLETLRNDPAFPKRLKTELEELTALSFYKQERWDSAAAHLSKALVGAPTLNEKARWEFLTGQLFERAGNFADAKQYYSRAIPHSTDLILEMQARIAAIRANRTATDNPSSNVQELLEMATKEKYNAYQDIIYFTAAQMDLVAGNKNRALTSLYQSTIASTNNTVQRNKAFLQLAEISYQDGAYAKAAQFYDSLKTTDSLPVDPAIIAVKKRALQTLVNKLAIVERQDSLLLLADLPEEERKEAVKKIVKQLRKQAGLQEEPLGNAPRPIATLPQPSSLFGNEIDKGEWYFYNVASRSRGQAAFLARWGNRPNMDNWRRAASMQATLTLTQANNRDSSGSKNSVTDSAIDFESLYAGLPLSPEKKKITIDSLSAALLDAGRILIQEIEDCPAGIKLLDRISNSLSNFENMDEVLFHQHNCAWLGGERNKAASISKELSTRFPGSKYTALLNGQGAKESEQKSRYYDSIYTRVYTLFTEGSYQQAVELKKETDRIVGDNHWTPQLLFIEAAYYVKERKDSTAIRLLRELQLRFPNSPLYLRAADLLEAIGRRASLEAAWSNSIVKKEETAEKKSLTTTNKTINNTAVAAATHNNPSVTADSTNQYSPYNWDEQTTHLALFVMEETEPVLAAEAMRSIDNYNRSTFNNRNFQKELINLDNRYRMIVIGSFVNLQEAIVYLDRAKPRTASEIVPWIPAGKYKWIPISAINLTELRQRKDLDAYQRFLNSKRP